MLLTDRVGTGCSNNPLLRFDYFARVAHLTPGNILLTRLPVYHKRIELRNSQAVVWGRGEELLSLGRTLSQGSMRPEALPTLSFGVCMEASFHRHD